MCIRDRILPARELVVGDLVMLDDGSMVPADLRLLDTASLRVQEASLTGESVPSEKDADAKVAPGAPLGDRSTMAFATSIVTGGRGRGVVTATGMRTEVGQIAGLLEGDEELDTPLKRKLASVSYTHLVAEVAAGARVRGRHQHEARRERHVAVGPRDRDAPRLHGLADALQHLSLIHI